MRIRRYRGHSMKRIQALIDHELGPNAVIVSHSTHVRKGLLPWRQIQEFEVVATAEEPVLADDINPNDFNALQDFISNQKDEYRGLRQSIKHLDHKLADVEALLAEQQRARPTLPCLDHVHDEWRDAIIDGLQRRRRDKKTPLREQCQQALADRIPVGTGIPHTKSQTGPRVIVVAGPTGVGKTTTLAKLAARCVLRDKLRVGFITIDTFRIAAIEQLREYATLLGVELEVAFSKTELIRHLSRFERKDVVFIDTPGRSHYDQLGLHDIGAHLGDFEKHVWLAIPAGIRATEGNTVIDRFRFLSPEGLIVTKTDESSCCDGLSTVISHSRLPIQYVTTGQQVPEDIEDAQPMSIAHLIMRREPTPSPIITPPLATQANGDACVSE